jgi:toxin ParE1/3/4
MTDLEYRVTTSALADEDIADIFEYISKNQSLERALLVLDTLEDLVASLSYLPMRGSRLVEVEIKSLGDYRQLISWPFRLIYRIDGQTVFVVAILDGRRNVVSLLEKRLTAISTK